MIDVVESDDRWRAEVAWRSRNGSRATTARTFSAREPALAWALALDGERVDEMRNGMTVAQLVLCWHDDRRPNLRRTTSVREESMLLRHIARDPIGALPAQAVTRTEAMAFGESLRLRDNGRGGHLAAKTRRHIQKAIRQAFDANLDIESNPFARVSLPPLPDAEADFLDMDEINILLRELERNRWGWAYGLLVVTGLRRSEFCGLRWSDVDLRAGHLDVRWSRATAAFKVVEGRPKTRRARRRVPLGPLGVRYLNERAAERDRQRNVWGPDWCPAGDEYVWALEDGSPPHPSQLTSEFAKFCDVAGIRRVGLHGLRHTFAAAAIAAGMAGYSLSRVMGHSQVTFTYSVYGHLFNDGLAGEMGKLSALLGNVP